MERHARVTTTQALARGRIAWSAVVAGEQTAGRGQAERTFTSDPGGLYVTAVLPYDGDALASRGFALAVGWALCGLLRELGVPRIRLRWPNDLMVGSRKVGGILVEQGGPDTLLVGVGLNVDNRPWLADASLQETAGRLRDAADPGALPAHEVLADGVLGAILAAHETFARERLAGMVPRLASCWGEPREVVLEPAGAAELPVQRGRFGGIAADGSLLLELPDGAWIRVAAHQIGRLRER